MSGSRAILTLVTDFGTADGFVGAMKGRVLSLAPNATIVDLSHEIPPQDVTQGAWCLRRAAPQFPPGTVHLAVVDPGVGSPRRGLVVETERFLFVGPDNGLLMWAAERDGIRRTIVIDPARGPWESSRSFDGLSLFATVAGHLLAGLDSAAAGDAVGEWTTLPFPRPRRSGGQIEGAVIAHDRFGNAITNIPTELIATGEAARIEFGTAGDRREARLCSHYAELEGSGNPGPPNVGAIWNSDGLLELFVFGGSARERDHIDVGTRVRMTLAQD